MAAHKTNPFLKWALIPLLLSLALIVIIGISKGCQPSTPSVIDKTLKNIQPAKNVKNNASKDSAQESLDTLTAELGETQQTVKSVIQTNAVLKAQNETLLSQLQGKKDQKTTELTQEVDHLKVQLQSLTNHPTADAHPINSGEAQPITHVPDLATTLGLGSDSTIKHNQITTETTETAVKTSVDSIPEKPIPYYTIPANATAVEDRLMTALVGRIPLKGVVTDPYPFKLVFSDNTLAANGFRVPHLKQMIVSGYTEGDLNLVSVRGWVTSLTFVFNDGTISTTTSNDNNIGKFTKDSALGYLSDQFGNPFIRGKLITNAPAYVGANILLGAAQGAANAYAQSQTTSSSNLMGSTSSVTGSPSAYMAGQAASSATSQVQQWWHDREAQSFDAIYVPTIDEKTNQPIFIAVNFSKEIQLDYNPHGRKIVYGHADHAAANRNLD